MGVFLFRASAFVGVKKHVHRVQIRAAEIQIAKDADFLHAVFALLLPRTHPGVWAHVPDADRTGIHITSVHRALSETWALQALGCIQTIWRWRHSHHDGEMWSSIQARATALSACAEAMHRARRAADSSARRTVPGALLAALAAADPAPTIASAAPRATDTYVLFFDGGSRGNPGPGGAGSVILRVGNHGHTATLIWNAVMSLASRSTTNNLAEYVGLRTGLRAAQLHQWLPLAVVGDSMLVLNQLSQCRPPRNDRLRQVYQDARILADQIGVACWTHNLRAWNKMADAAANVAMNHCRSIQTFHPTDRSEWQGLPALLPSDFLQWQTST